MTPVNNFLILMIYATSVEQVLDEIRVFELISIESVVYNLFILAVTDCL